MQEGKGGEEAMVALDDELDVEPATTPGTVPPLEEQDIAWPASEPQASRPFQAQARALPSSKGAFISSMLEFRADKEQARVWLAESGSI